MFAQMRKAIKGEKGLFDLTSVMTGVIITGFMAALVTATLVVIIPWFHDKTAKDDINLIKMAQDSHYSDTGLYTNDVTVLKTKKYLHQTTTSTCIQMTSLTASTYTIYVQSISGKKFSYDPSQTAPVETTTIPCTLRT